jgi:hypothetical protein
MGPPEWLEEHEEEMNLSDPISCIENKEVIVLKSVAEKHEAEYNLLQTKNECREKQDCTFEYKEVIV